MKILLIKTQNVLSLFAISVGSEIMFIFVRREEWVRRHGFEIGSFRSLKGFFIYADLRL